MLDEAQKELSTPEFKKKLLSLYLYLVRRLGVNQAPTLKLIDSKKNADNPFGFTGYYDHENKHVVLYMTNRLDTDILRSFAHEIIHHWQNERGVLQPNHDTENASHYAQNDPWLRKREMEAYLFGNILFRDWQDEQRSGPPKTVPFLPRPYD